MRDSFSRGQGGDPCPWLAAICPQASGDGSLTTLQGSQTTLPCLWHRVKVKMCLTQEWASRAREEGDTGQDGGSRY